MIVGIGTDLIEIERVKKACEKEAFVKRYFSEREVEAVKGELTKLANNFAAKEAVSKCFGTGFRGFSPIDIEVLRDEYGKPYVVLHREASNIAAKMGINNILLSISDTKDFSQAFAVCECTTGSA